MLLMEKLKEKVKAERADDTAAVLDYLHTIITELLSVAPPADLETDLPLACLVVGVNGVGKTTSIAKLTAQFRAKGRSCLLVAGDTFRAAAIDQLAIWAERTGADFVSHQEGADPGRLPLTVYLRRTPARPMWSSSIPRGVCTPKLISCPNCKKSTG